MLSIKGRFACELSTGDELVLTNMVFDGCFNDLTGRSGSIFCGLCCLMACVLCSGPGRVAAQLLRFKEGGDKDSWAAVRDNMQVWLPLDIQLTVA